MSRIDIPEFHPEERDGWWFQDAVVVNKNGIHARPSAQFYEQVLLPYGKEIELFFQPHRGGNKEFESVRGITDVMVLGLEMGTRVTVKLRYRGKRDDRWDKDLPEICLHRIIYDFFTNNFSETRNLPGESMPPLAPAERDGWWYQEVTVLNWCGLHVRPTTKFFETVLLPYGKELDLEVRVSKQGDFLPIRSVFDLICLGLEMGATLTVKLRFRGARDSFGVDRIPERCIIESIYNLFLNSFFLGEDGGK